MGGDTVAVRDGQVFVNDEPLEEPYLFRNAAGAVEPTIAGVASRWVVPECDLFVMGDHRQVSGDRRVLGPIPSPLVIGRAAIRY